MRGGPKNVAFRRQRGGGAGRPDKFSLCGLQCTAVAEAMLPAARKIPPLMIALSPLAGVCWAVYDPHPADPTLQCSSVDEHDSSHADAFRAGGTPAEC